MAAIGLSAALVLGATAALAEAPNRVGASGLPLPRYASVSRDLANFRRGPGRDYAIAIEITRRGLPVRIIGEHGNWRRVELHTRERGWIHRALLSGERTVLALDGASLFDRPDGAAVATPPEAAPLRLRRCEANWCLVAAEGRRFWARRDALWGVDG